MGDDARWVKVQADQDQVWAAIRNRGPDVERVAINGPQSNEDVRLVKAVMLAVAGMLRLPDGPPEQDD